MESENPIMSTDSPIGLNDTAKLKPCPFCGEELTQPPAISGYHVHSHNGCFNQSMGILDSHIARWNTRASLDAIIDAQGVEQHKPFSQGYIQRQLDAAKEGFQRTWGSVTPHPDTVLFHDSGDNPITHKDLYDECPSCQDKEEDMQILRQRLNEAEASLAESEKTNFVLSANQCHNGYGDDYGNHRCKYQDKLASLEQESGEATKQEDVVPRHLVAGLRNEVDCRIEHGAESGGHLDYVRKALDKILEEYP